MLLYQTGAAGVLPQSESVNRSGKRQMSVAGSSIFTDADGYQASLQDMLDLLVICPRQFHARLTWVELPHVQLMRAEESSSRVAYLRLPPEQVFVFFATHRGAPLVHGGKEVCFGD